MEGWRISAAGAAFLSCLAVPAWSAPVLFISIDGLRPLDVLEAEAKGLKLPHLQRFVDEGSWAKGVKGVLPTITYPSHTTLITGASPARHGIYGNTTFDPMQINQGGWYWYGADIRRETLWDAAAKMALTTGNVHWPVSVGVKSITWNLPQIWRTGHEDDAKLLSALATPGLVRELEKESGPYAAGIDETIEGDEKRAQFALKLIASHRPEFLTVYLTALDHEQHVAGPDSASARRVLERLDVVVGKLMAAAQEARPDTVVAIASDHGFAALDTEVNLFRAFIDNGLINLDKQGKVASWRAMPWPSGGSAAIMLSDPQNEALQNQVADLLTNLHSNPEVKIDRVLDASALKSLGGNPKASFYVAFKPGASAGSFKGASAPLVGPSSYKGTHGYLPAEPSMRASFMIMGPNIMRGRNLGIIDIRTIAPTLAAIMGTRLPAAELPALDVGDRP